VHNFIGMLPDKTKIDNFKLSIKNEFKVVELYNDTEPSR